MNSLQLNRHTTILSRGTILCVAFLISFLVGCTFTITYKIKAAWITDSTGRAIEYVLENKSALIVVHDGYRIEFSDFSIYSGDEILAFNCVLWGPSGGHAWLEIASVELNINRPWHKRGTASTGVLTLTTENKAKSLLPDSRINELSSIGFEPSNFRAEVELLGDFAQADLEIVVRTGSAPATRVQLTLSKDGPWFHRP
jgi:hypothetical protein